MAEVLALQPAAIQDFLLRTSILPRLHPDLCAFVTDQPESAQLLESIERANLFLEALDGADEWYRYHPLFAEAMQHVARQRLGEQVLSTLFYKASGWFEQHDFSVDAIELALQMPEREHAASLVERHLQHKQYMHVHEAHTLLRWLRQVPEDILDRHPLLCFSLVVALVFTRERELQSSEQLLDDRFEALLRSAEERWQADNDLAGQGRVLAFRAFLGMQHSDRAQSRSQAKQALEWLPVEEHVWRGISYIALGLDALQRGQLFEARRIFQELRVIWKAVGDLNALGGLMMALSFICLEQGELHQAARYFHEVDEAAIEARISQSAQWCNWAWPF